MVRGLVVMLGLACGAAVPLAEVTGVVRDPSGRPVPAARVVLRSASGAVVAETNSDEEGRYRLSAPGAGSHLLVASREGFREAQAALRLEPASRVERSLVLSISPVASEITVSAETGQAVEAAFVAQRVNRLERNVLEERVTTTIAEAAEGEAGVQQIRTSPAMGAFLVRGLTGKNVAIYKDGVRYTTSAQRGGVSTFLNMNEAATLEAVEVLRGPNGAQYGSDSVGGTVNLLSAAADMTPQPALRGEAAAQYYSASRTPGASMRLLASAPRWSLATALAARRVNTLRSGGGLDSHAAVTRFLGLPSSVLGERLPDTAFTQYGGSLHAQARLTDTRQMVFHYERNQQDGTKRYDQLAGGDGNLIADVRNLMLDFGWLRYQDFQPGGIDHWSATLSYNAQREERVNQGGQGNPAASIQHQYERTRAWGLQLQAGQRWGKHDLLAGAEAYHERIAAPAYNQDPVSLAVTLARPRVPHGARYLSHGLFVQDAWQAGERLRMSAAVRYGGASYASRSANSPIVGGRPLWPGDSLAANAISGRAGAVLDVAGPLKVHGQYSRGFRVPNVTDLGTLGLQGNGFFEISTAELAGAGAMVGDRADDRARSTGAPVARLRPEKSDNVEAGAQIRTSRVKAEATFFHIALGNAVVSQTLLLPAGALGRALGDQTISRQLESGAVFVPLAPNPVLVRANYGGARYRGVEQSARVRLLPAWHLQQNFTRLHAGDRNTGLPPDIEPGVPPATLNASLLWAPPARRYWVEVYSTAAGRQERLSSLALADRRIGAPRSRSNISSFFNNGARARGLVANGRLTATGETLEQVQNRVLGSASSAPLYAEIPGWFAIGVRAGFPAGARGDIMLDFSNLADRNYRGVGWGVDAAGRSLSVRYRLRF